MGRPVWPEPKFLGWRGSYQHPQASLKRFWKFAIFISRKWSLLLAHCVNKTAAYSFKITYLGKVWDRKKVSNFWLTWHDLRRQNKAPFPLFPLVRSNYSGLFRDWPDAVLLLGLSWALLVFVCFRDDTRRVVKKPSPALPLPAANAVCTCTMYSVLTTSPQWSHCKS